MSQQKKALLLIAIQCLLVLTIVGKFLYERKTCPRVWARAFNVDPNSPLRGRYLVLSPEVYACGLKRYEGFPGSQLEGTTPAVPNAMHVQQPQDYIWNVRLSAKDGKLVAEEIPNAAPGSSTIRLFLDKRESCGRAVMVPGVDYYIPDTENWPPQMDRSDSLWVEVTVPPAGPPRPIQLAISHGGTFTPLKLN